MQRGHERDVTDAQAMVARGLVEPMKLRELFASIESALVRYPGIDASEFRAVVEKFCQSHAT